MATAMFPAVERENAPSGMSVIGPEIRYAVIVSIVVVPVTWTTGAETVTDAAEVTAAPTVTFTEAAVLPLSCVSALTNAAPAADPWMPYFG